MLLEDNTDANKGMNTLWIYIYYYVYYLPIFLPVIFLYFITFMHYILKCN